MNRRRWDFLKLEVPEKPMVVLQMYRQEAYVKPFFNIGMDAYVPLEFVTEELEDAIRAVSIGRVFKSRHID